MSAASPNVSNLVKTFIHSVEDAKKLFRDLHRPTKVELNNLWNKLWENTVNIPNPTCIGGKFELSISITNESEWLFAEMGRLNQERLEAAKAVRATDNAKLAAETPPKASDTLIIIYTYATKNECDPYPKLTNPGRFAINTTKSAKVITINKIKQDMKLKEYAAYTVVDSAVQYFLRKVFGTKTFADMFISENFVLYKYTTL